MPLVRLTQELAERAKPGVLLCDDKVTGLLLISQKRVKTWCAQREVKDAETGIRKTARVKLGHFPDVSVQEARDLAKEELRKMEKGRNPHQAKQPGLTLKAAVEEYISGEVNLRPRTIDGYRYHLKHYLSSIAERPLSELGNKPMIVRSLYKTLSEKPGKATAVGAMRTLSAVYNGMRKLNPDLPLNPVRPGVITMHKLPKRKTRIAEEDFTAWAETLQTMPNPIRRAFRMFLLLTGQRDTATSEMKWSNVDLRKGKEKVHYPDPKGGPEAAFDLPLSPQVVTILEFVLAFSTEGWSFPGSEWVWPAYSASGHIEESKEQRRKNLLSPHPLRRTFISEGYEVAPAKLVSYIVNHACKDNITDDYVAPSQEAVRRALVTIDKAIMAKISIDLDKLLGEKKLTSTQFRSAAAV